MMLQGLARLSLSGLLFLLLVSLDLGLDILPVDLDLLAVLHEQRLLLDLVSLGEVALTVSNDSVNVRLVLQRNIEGAIPLVLLDVHFDSTIEETILQQNVLSFLRLLAVESKSSVSARFRRQLLNVVDVLHLVSFVDRGQGNFDRVQLMRVDRHGSKAGPQGIILDETAHTDGLIEVLRLHMLIKHSRVRRDAESSKGAVKSAHADHVAIELSDVGHLANVVGLLDSEGLVHEVTITVDTVRVEPGLELAIAESSEHIIRIVPGETVDHVADLLGSVSGLVDKGKEHILVAIDEAHLTLTGHRDLVEVHLEDLSRMLNVGVHGVTSTDVVGLHKLGVGRIDDGEHVGTE